MRSRTAVWSLVALAVATGCGGDSPGAGTAEMCAGSYSGAFSGTESGTIQGTLSPDGAFAVTFTGSAGSLSGTGMLGADGRVNLQLGSNVIAGSLNASCQAAGTWTYGGGGSGTWQMRRLAR